MFLTQNPELRPFTTAATTWIMFTCCIQHKTSTRSQAVARIADRTHSTFGGHATLWVTWFW